MIRKHFHHFLTVLRVLILAGAAVYAIGGNSSSVVPHASAAGGPAGTPAAGGATLVAVVPTVGLADGSAVGIAAQVPEGIKIFEVRAHICRHGANIHSTYDFGWSGKFCASAPVGHGDFDKAVKYDQGTQLAAMEFAAGVGTVSWIDENSFPHTLRCGSGSPCDLVVQLQITGTTSFFTAPLCFGGGCGPEPGPYAQLPAPGQSLVTTTTTAPKAPKTKGATTPKGETTDGAASAAAAAEVTTTTTTAPCDDASAAASTTSTTKPTPTSTSTSTTTKPASASTPTSVATTTKPASASTPTSVATTTKPASASTPTSVATTTTTAPCSSSDADGKDSQSGHDDRTARVFAAGVFGALGGGRVAQLIGRIGRGPVSPGGT